MNKIVEINVQTNEIFEIVMSEEEITRLNELDQRAAVAEAQIKAEATAAKAALLEKLGITEEEAKLLLS